MYNGCKYVSKNKKSSTMMCNKYAIKQMKSVTAFYNELKIYRMNIPYIPKLLSYSYFPPVLYITKIEECNTLDDFDISFDDKIDMLKYV